MPIRKQRRPFLLPMTFTAAMGISGSSQAGTDEDALNLADATLVVQERVSPWRLSTEANLAHTQQRYGPDDYNSARLSLDMHYDAVFRPDWRLVLSDRIDRTNSSGNVGNDSVNSLREAYVSWRSETNVIGDIGRINARYGAAYGYNPTDFFRSSSLRSIPSIDPNSLRENRLGTGMLRGQVLFENGSVTALYAPKLVPAPSDKPFNADFGATNNRDRWIISGSRQFSDNANPQFLLFGGSGQSVQTGVNFSALVNQATVGYVEWSGGAGRSLYADATRANEARKFRQRFATGLTYTNAYKMSITTEFEYNGAGLGKNGLSALASTDFVKYMRYRTYAQDQQDLPTRTTVFLYGTWQDAFVTHLDLKAMVRMNLDDRSRLNWIEARYHFTKIDLSVQLQKNVGIAASEYGGLPQSQMLQAIVTYYF